MELPCVHEVDSRGIRIDRASGIIKIPLRNARRHIIAYAKASIDKYELLSPYSYHAVKKGRKIYAAAYVDGADTSMQELVIGKKAPPGHKIDHKNGNGLDNTNENLRFATDSQNVHSQAKKEGTSSRYFGVSWAEKSKKWRSGIVCQGVIYNLGVFDNEKDAAYIFDIWDLYLYGEFSVCNVDENGKPLLSDEMVNYIVTEKKIPEGYERKTVVKKSGLPRCIYNVKNKKKVSFNFLFRYTHPITKTKLYISKKYDTLDEAVARRDAVFGALKRNEIRARRRQKFVTANGVYYIEINYHKKKIKFFVDKHVWYDIIRFRWHITGKGKYLQTRDIIKGKQIKLHNYIFLKYGGKLRKGETVDHINSKNVRDNRLSNLRAASKSLQTFNTIQPRKSRLRYKGVTFASSKFQAALGKNFLGLFDTEEDAARKVNEAAAAIYGASVVANIIDTENTTIDCYFNEKIITPKFIMETETIHELQEILRVREDWREEMNIWLADINMSNFLEHLNNVYELALEEQEVEEQDLEEAEAGEAVKFDEKIEIEEDDDIYAQDEEEVYVENVVLDCDVIKKEDEEEIVGDFEYIVEAIKNDPIFFKPGDDFTVDDDEDIKELLKKTPKPAKVYSYKDGTDYKKKCKMLNEYVYTNTELRKIYPSHIPKYTEEYIRSLTIKQEIKDVYLSRPDWKEKCVDKLRAIQNIETHKDYMCIMLNRENEGLQKLPPKQFNLIIK